MTASEAELKGYRAAVAVLAACYGDVNVTVAELLDGADTHQVIAGLGHLGTELLQRLHPQAAQDFLKTWSTTVAGLLAELSQPGNGAPRDGAQPPAAITPHDEKE